MSVYTTAADETVSTLLEIVRSSDQPVIPAKLKRKGLTGKRAQELLEQLAVEKQVYRWTKGKSAAYWHVPGTDYAVQQMLALARDQAFARPALAKAAAKRCFGRFSGAKCRPLIKELLQSGQLSELAGPGGPRIKVLFATDRPAAYLRTLADYVSPFLRSIEERGSRREQFLEVLHGPSAQASKQSDAKQNAEQVYGALREMQREFSVDVPVRQLREHPRLAGWSKENFDAAVLQLAAERRIQLSRHDDVFHTTPEMREELVFEPPDKYYVAIAARD